MTLRYSLITLGFSALFAVLIWYLLSWDPLVSWLIAVSIVTFLTYGYDKSVAGTRQTRIPERTLLLLALLGGSLGAYAGMRLFHHKTLKSSFQRRFWAIVAIQVVLVGLYFVMRHSL
jgi:uncharacterized membrane protein YsdA (DUF1294 family)